MIVIDRGRIVEEGSYEALIAQRGPTYELSRRQMI